MSTSPIRLNFINRSDSDNSRIVIFQKNEAQGFNGYATAWKVIENCGRLDNHPFDFPLTFEVGAADSDGNYTPQLTAAPGDVFELHRDNSGDVLCRTPEKTTNPAMVEFRNGLDKGAAEAICYKNGKPMASYRHVAPDHKALFEFKPTIWIGAVDGVAQGDAINSALLQSINTELNLLGIESADIVMTGGGSGAEAAPLRFALENVT